MSRQHSISFTPTLRVFISKVVTPLVLVAGLLFLIVFNFRGVLKTTVTDADHFHGLVSFSQGAFAYSFRQTAGIDRPLVRYNNQDLLVYAEWSSTLSVDGRVQQLWNTDHGYSVDENRRQSFNTITGRGWQLTEIVTLVDDHTMTVMYNLVPQPTQSPTPAQYVLNLVHTHNTWYGYKANSNTFSALVAGGEPLTDGVKPATYGAITLKAEGDAAAHPQLNVTSARGVATAQGTINQANAFTTEYVVTNPVPFQMITLGTETITFQPGASDVSAPINGTVPLTPIPVTTPQAKDK